MTVLQDFLKKKMKRLEYDEKLGKLSLAEKSELLTLQRLFHAAQSDEQHKERISKDQGTA